MRLERHPLVARDIDAILDHIVEMTGDFGAAERRLDEIAALVAEVAANPLSGTRLDGPLAGCLSRHGGRGRMLTVVFEPRPDRGVVRVLLVAFGGQDWMGLTRIRSGPSGD